MQDLWVAIEASGIATHLRMSRWTYPFVNAGHLLGVGLLIGAIAPLDLRLMGAWRSVPLPDLARVLRPVAATGATLAILTGAALFSVNAREYAATMLFAVKMTLVAVGLLHALSLTGDRLAAASPLRQRLAGALSLTIWVAALTCGRWLGYL